MSSSDYLTPVRPTNNTDLPVLNRVRSSRSRLFDDRQDSNSPVRSSKSPRPQRRPVQQRASVFERLTYPKDHHCRCLAPAQSSTEAMEREREQERGMLPLVTEQDEPEENVVPNIRPRFLVFEGAIHRVAHHPALANRLAMRARMEGRVVHEENETDC